MRGERRTHRCGRGRWAVIAALALLATLPGPAVSADPTPGPRGAVIPPASSGPNRAEPASGPPRAEERKAPPPPTDAERPAPATEAAAADLGTGSITGTIRRDSDGGPVKDVCVFSLIVGGTWSECSSTASDGTYVLPDLAPGSYRIWAGYPLSEELVGEYYDDTTYFDQADLVTVSTSSVSGIDLSLAAGGRIEGKLVSDIDQMATPSMHAVASNDTSSETGYVRGPDGSYSIRWLAPGQYRVGFSGQGYVSEYYDDQPSWGAAQLVTVIAGATTSGIDAGLAIGAWITGRVTKDDGGAPVVGATVLAGIGSDFVHSAQTGDDGWYVLTGLPPGDYRVQVVTEGFVDEFYDDARAFADAQVIPVTAASTTTDIDFGLAAGGSISGTVTLDSTGAAVEQACVAASPADATGQLYVDCYPEDGQYTITGLPADDYVVEVISLATPALRFEFYDDVTDQADATPITVAAGAAVDDIDFGLAEVTTGQLRVTTTPPLPAEISVDGAARDSWGLNWVGLPAGPHEVCFGEVAGYVAPPCQTVDLVGGQTTTIGGTYSPQGYLRVVTSPAVPSTVTVDGVARNDYGLWSEVAPGSHDVCFGAVSGFDTPSCQQVVVAPGATSTVTGTFSANAAAPGPAGTFGFLRATTSPAVGAMISVDGQWRNNWGLDWLKVPTGAHEVCFGSWQAMTPPVTCTVVQVGAGATSTVEGTYSPKGFLRVVTSPEVHADVFVDGAAANAFGMWTAKAPGFYRVCFGAVPELTTPPCQQVEVTAGNTTTATGVYAP